MPLVIFATIETNFRGYVGMDLHSADAPQIVWYYSNAPSNASGVTQVDQVNSIVQERSGDLLFADAGSGPPPFGRRTFTGRSRPTERYLAESPIQLRVSRQRVRRGPRMDLGYGNDSLEQLDPGRRRNSRNGSSPGARSSKDPFFDAGRLRKALACRTGIGIARWTPATGDG